MSASTLLKRVCLVRLDGPTRWFAPNDRGRLTPVAPGPYLDSHSECELYAPERTRKVLDAIGVATAGDVHDCDFGPREDVSS
jgi:hypothetical protein